MAETVFKVNGKVVPRDTAMEGANGLPYGELFSFALKGTDSQFMAGMTNGGGIDSISPHVIPHVLAAAKKAGVSLDGRKHISGLGPITDMSTWVDGSGDVVREARRQNKVVNFGGREIESGHEVPPPKGNDLAPDIVEELRQERIEDNPDLAYTNQSDLREQILDDHTPHYKKRGKR